MHFSPMMLMGLLCAAGLPFGLVLTLGGRKSEQTYQRRVAAILAAHRPDQPRGPARSSVLRDIVPDRPIDRLGHLFGIVPARRVDRRNTIVFILAATLAAGWAISFAAHLVIGRFALALVPVLWIVLSRVAFGWLADRHAGRLRSQMPDALGMIVRSVRVGIPIAEGVRAVGRDAAEPTAELFRRIAGETAIGVALEDALENVTAKENLQEYRFFATALSLQSRTGGGLSETLDNLAEIIRKRLAARARGYALAAEARTSALILACLPLLALGGLLLVNPTYISVLFTDPLGNDVLFAAIASQSLGILAMRALIRKALT